MRFETAFGNGVGFETYENDGRHVAVKCTKGFPLRHSLSASVLPPWLGETGGVLEGSRHHFALSLVFMAGRRRR